MSSEPDLNLKLSQELYEEDKLETGDMKGLNFVDFYFLPHLNAEWSKKLRKENIEKAAGNMNITIPIYALDDESALKVVDDKVEVISEGDWFVLNEK